MSNPGVRPKSIASPTDEMQAIDLLRSGMAPITLKMLEDIRACYEAVEQSRVIALSMQKNWPEDVIVALGTYGEAVLGAFRKGIVKGITQLKTLKSGLNSAVEANQQSGLELVSNNRVEEDLATMTLTHRLHVTTQEYAQSVAVRLSRIWPQAYITEVSVPCSAAYIAQNLSAALRTVNRDFMTSRVRVLVLTRLAVHWFSELPGLANQIAADLGGHGWVPNITPTDIGQWRSRLDAMTGNTANDPSFQANQLNQRPMLDAETPHKAPVPELKAQTHPVAQTLASSQTVEACTAFDIQAAVQSARRIEERYASDVSSALLPMQHTDVVYAEPLLSRLQDEVYDLERPILVDAAKIVKNHASKRSNVDISDALVQRIVAAQNTINALISDDGMQELVKHILIKLQMPWTRYLLQSSDSLADTTDPFKEVLWTVSSVGRRSSNPEADGSGALFRKIISFFERAVVIDETVVQKALIYLRDKLEQQNKRSRLVTERSTLSWQGQATVAEKRHFVSREIARQIGDRKIPASMALVVKEHIIPTLLLYSLKGHLSDEDEAQRVMAWEVVRLYIEMRLNYDARLMPIKNISMAYRRCKAVFEKAGSGTARLAEDNIQFMAHLERLRAHFSITAGSVMGQPSVPLEMLVVLPSDQPDEPPENNGPALDVEDDHIERARNLSIGSWLRSKSGDQPWCGRVATHIKFKDSVIIVDRNGMKVNELNHKELGAKLKAGEIEVMEDASYFTRALECMVKSVRQYRKAS